MEDEFRERMAALRREYLRQLPGKLAQIAQAWAAAQRGEAGALRRLHQGLHGLTGSGATFGLSDLSRTAREAERAVKPLAADDRLPGEAQSAEIDALLRALCGAAPAEAESGGEAASAPQGAAEEKAARPLVHWIAADAEPAQRLAAQLGQFGYAVQLFCDPAEALQAHAREAAAAVVVDIPGCGMGAPEACCPVFPGPRPPILFLSWRADFPARLGAVRAGADAYLCKPVDAGTLADRLDTLCGGTRAEPPRVLIVEDSATLAEIYAQSLRRAGMETRTESDPLKIMDALASFRPELILMDIHMPGASGEEVAKVLRQQDGYVGIPIVFLSAETDAARQQSAIGLGGDDFLVKPIPREVLVAAVAGRVERYRVLRSYMIRDSLTGLLNQASIKEHLDIEMARAVRQGRPVAFAAIEIDGFSRVNKEHGHAAGDAVLKSLSRLLRRRLRKMDLVGRYGGEEFAAILPDTEAADSFRVLDGVRRDLSGLRLGTEGGGFSVTVSCGIAAYPEFATAEDIASAAGRALSRAKREGGDRIVRASGAPSEER